MALIEVIAIGVLILFCLAGIAIVPFGLPGTFVVAASALIYNLITWSWQLPLNLILVLFGLAIAGEIFEWLLGAYSAKKFGASKWGVAGAIIGAIIGAILGTPIPLIGNIIGMIAGAFLGAFILEIIVKRNISRAFRAGIGAFIGRIGAILLKTVLAIAMFVIIVASLYVVI